MKKNHLVQKKENQIRNNVLNKLSAPANLYCLLAGVGALVLLGCFLFSRGKLIQRYFFYDTADTGMDFFNSIANVNGRAPYEIFNTLYPPLADLFFYFLFLFIPEKVSSKWPLDFMQCVRMRTTDLDLRVHQAPMLIFIIYSVLVTVLLVFLFISLFKRLGNTKANLCAFFLIISPGVLFSLERGNILLLATLLSLFYLYFRNSNNKVLREFSLLSLAAAAGLKLYPALFGILLLKDKQYKRAARAVLYGVLSVVLPVFAFKEGFKGLQIWVSHILNFNAGNAGDAKNIPWIGRGFSNILNRIELYLNKFFGIEIGTGWFFIAALIVTGFMLITAFTMKEEWQSIFVITFAMVLFHSQGMCIVILFCIPLCFFITKEQKLTKSNFLPFLIMTLLTVNVPLFYTRWEHYPNIVFYQGLLLLAVAWSVFIFVQNIRDLRRKNGRFFSKPHFFMKRGQ